MGASLLLALLVAPSADAQELGGEVRERCLRSIVRIVAHSPNGSSQGSGTLIDPRGYILTNFHVVGRGRPEGGLPGTLIARRFHIAVTQNEVDEVQPQYLAEVVRGSIAMDLALLRIVARIDDAPLGESSFQAMPIAQDTPSLGTQVWALGFPGGVDTINVTGGQISGLQANRDHGIAWLRTDTEFNPGNSGGALIDRQGRLVAIPTAMFRSIEPIELARPATRIPAEWLESLLTGQTLQRLPTEGIVRLNRFTDTRVTAQGDGIDPSSEMRYYALPRDRPAVITARPRVQLHVLGAGGRAIRGGHGQLLITRSDGPHTFVAVHLPRSQSGAPRVRLRYLPMQPTAPTGSGSALLSGRVTLQERAQACRVVAVLASEEDDLEAALGQLSRGDLDESEFRQHLVAITALDDDGRFELRAMPGTYHLGLIAHGHIQSQIVQIGPDGAALHTIAFDGNCN